MKTPVLVAVAAAAVTFIGTIAIVIAKDAGKSLAHDAGDRTAAQIEQGRYIAKTAGCNDCHTPGYMPKEGAVEESVWLTGSPDFGFQGPWGTTYAPNLRIYVNRLTEAQWLEVARNLKTRPPMPWFNVQAMSDEDLKAFYQYVRWLGPAGEMAPAYVPPGEPVNTLVAVFP